jgi:hypothetical protein
LSAQLKSRITKRQPVDQFEKHPRSEERDDHERASQSPVLDLAKNEHNEPEVGWQPHCFGHVPVMEHHGWHET